MQPQYNVWLYLLLREKGNAMLTIHQPKIINYNGRTRLVCAISENKTTKTVWFEVAAEYEKYLCHERSDAFLIGLLIYAMKRNHDITCTAPVTEDLLYNIESQLIPTLAKYGKNAHHTKICASTSNCDLEKYDGVGTGMSCGTDSFHTVANHYKPKYPSLKLTHLCINNVGSFSSQYEKFYGMDRAKQSVYARSRFIANLLHLPLIETDSNFHLEFPQNHAVTHTYSSVFAIYCMQKLWRTYFYSSSGYDYSLFSVHNHTMQDCAFYELLSLNAFSTKQLRIYSEGGEKDRLEKTAAIINMPIAQKYIHVCVLKGHNCGVCLKCRRTLLALDALNAVDKFAQSFNVEYYKDNKIEYLRWIYTKIQEKDVMLYPIYEALKNGKYSELIRKIECGEAIDYRREKTQNAGMKKTVHITIKPRVKVEKALPPKTENT